MKLNAQGIKKGSELQAYPGLRLAEESPVPDKAALPALFSQPQTWDKSAPWELQWFASAS